MSSQNPDEPKKTTEGGGDSAGLSFGGIANTLLQWKLNKARAVKRRSQSIAIVSILAQFEHKHTLFNCTAKTAFLEFEQKSGFILNILSTFYSLVHLLFI